jgi:hypothetical protein
VTTPSHGANCRPPGLNAPLSLRQARSAPQHTRMLYSFTHPESSNFTISIVHRVWSFAHPRSAGFLNITPCYFIGSSPANTASAPPHTGCYNATARPRSSHFSSLALHTKWLRQNTLSAVFSTLHVPYSSGLLNITLRSTVMPSSHFLSPRIPSHSAPQLLPTSALPLRQGSSTLLSRDPAPPRCRLHAAPPHPSR